ncbi:hypothetical protein GAP32_350 [Cronobacter phage vB_CsaM_GAP32]|uniref:Uncharacterized protein n=1 Tax=Cronobacter phage vB_CsaM_GAP32 TaxID=1141136 RepID=K4F9N0_9CAUD|nr:hypothetical protein GAP32_350 [Cronobacter phage vB_CsaM_GAP32]AFC21800.1 hypothetical protein GAP32_350 [Cronobacter phage vB_CsaM_GAP32]
MDEQFSFDDQLECIYRAIRGLERTNFNGTESEALDHLQATFTNLSRDELQKIYRLYGEFPDFEI